MPSPASSSPSFVLRLVSHAWWILLLAALALLAIATDRRIQRVEALTRSSTWSVDAPARDRASATGLERGQRTLIVPGLHTPSFWWIMDAQKAAELGHVRLRHIDYDSPPNGRDTRRTSPYRWWLTAVGWGRASITGEPLGFAIERGTLVADPLLLGLLLVVGAFYVARCFGPLAATGFVVAGISLFPLAANFQPGAPDSHSLAWVLAVGTLLPLLVSPQNTGLRRRTHVIIAGVIGGLGFWNSATSQAPLLLAIFLGAVGYELTRGSKPASPTTIAPNWRAWALPGAVTTLAASLFEFAPNHFSWSLDAVSPVHALAWWGFGEVLNAMQIRRNAGRTGLDRRSLTLLTLGLVAIAAWPAAGFVGGTGGLLASDFQALELANHPRGATAPRLGTWLDQSADTGAKWATLLPLLLCIVLAVRLLTGRLEREERSRLLLILVVAIFLAVLGCIQLRWWNLFDSVALCGMATLLAGFEGSEIRKRWALLGAVLLVIPGAVIGFPAAINGSEVKDINPADAQALVARDFSYWLVKRSGADREVLYSTPIFSSAASFYGGFAAVTTSDEENRTGYLAATRIATANTLDEASVLFQSRGITRVALPLWDPMLPNLVRVGRNLSSDTPLPDDALLVGLLRWGAPVWMRPMNYVVPQETGLGDFQLVSYAVQAPVETDLFLSRLADFFVERGLLQEAASVCETLKDFPRSPAALGAVARVDLARRDQAHLAEALEKLIPYLSRISVRNLPVDRHLSLAVLLLQTRHADLARDQLTAVLKHLDVDTLRTLTPGAVKDLLVLSRALNVPLPDEALKTAALGLVPPGLRVRLSP